MFERYTEKARRVVFFAYYEANHYSSPLIETEHILLGVLREYPELAQLLPSMHARHLVTKYRLRLICR
jgi:ATP-dependent Clp protease ATP-binding subunit ClpC